jgi:hypothetical protein
VALRNGSADKHDDFVHVASPWNGHIFNTIFGNCSILDHKKDIKRSISDRDMQIFRREICFILGKAINHRVYGEHG